MSSSKNPSNSANQDDPWEQLAEDLFGLEYGKEHASLEPSGGPAETDAGETDSGTAPVAHQATHSAREAAREETGPEVFSAREEPPRFAADAIGKSEPAFEDDSGADSEESAGPEEFNESAAVEPASEKPVSPQDSYWDALANWNWDESEGGAGRPRSGQSRSEGGAPSRGGSKGRDEGRGRRGGDRPQRQSSAPAAGSLAGSPSSHAPRPPAPAATDDFGLGVVEPEPGFSAPVETAAVERHPAHTARDESQPRSGDRHEIKTESTAERGEVRGGARGDVHRGDRGAKRPDERGSAAGEEGEPRKRRRRRRRRRGGRGGEGAPGGSSEATSSIQGTVPDDSAGPEADLPEEEGEPILGDFSDEPIEKIAEERPARESRHGRRPQERSRGPASDRSPGRFVEEDEEEPQEMVLAGGAGELEHDANQDDDGDDSEEQKVSYEDVPTWEEAISYLLHPNQVQVEGGGGASNQRDTQSGDQPRQTRHIGHRKHRG